MKLDISLVKNILQFLEKECDGDSQVLVGEDDCEGYTQEQVNYHLEILKDDGLLKFYDNMQYMNGFMVIRRLSAEGHRVLEGLSNSKVLEEVKQAGVDTLKQVPAICIGVLLNGMLSS
ncbi:MAG: DUF2513 domain-containing protein [Rickettsiales bacterium]|nr:DUF2513 domain-containing protein [Rickettsiales bacterium]